MVRQARRLREAFLDANPTMGLPAGASDDAIGRAVAAFAPLHVPTELLGLLRVMDGSAGAWILLGQVGPLLSALEVITDTRSRAAAAEDNSAWCPGWVVITAEQWSFSALLAETAPRPRSAAVDLSYGNQAYPVVAASLTALVAASADAWSLGVHEDQASKIGPQHFKETQSDRESLLKRRSAQYPSGDGLTVHDEVGPWQLAWPISWPRPKHPDPLDIYPPVPVMQAADISHGIAHSVIEVSIDAMRGRWFYVRDASGGAWIDVPPGLYQGHSLVIGSRWQMSVDPPSPFPLPAPPDDLPGPTLRATGILRRVQ